MENKCFFNKVLIVIFFCFFIPIKSNATFVSPVVPGYSCDNECQIERERQKEIREQKKKEAEKEAEKRKIYEERKEVLAPYSQFFEEFDVTLNIKTADYKYHQWLKQLKERKETYDKEQEEQRIKKEQEERERIEQERIREEIELQEKIRELVNQELENRELIISEKQPNIEPAVKNQPVVTQKVNEETVKPKVLEETNIKKENDFQKINTNMVYTQEQIKTLKKQSDEMGVPSEAFFRALYKQGSTIQGVDNDKIKRAVGLIEEVPAEQLKETKDKERSTITEKWKKFVSWLGFKTVLDKKVFCSEFNEQASKRIDTYYTNGDQTNIYPTELFYSPIVESCIAVWKNSVMHETGIAEELVIFDAITNDDYFSRTIFDLFDSDNYFEQRNANIRKDFNAELDRLRG